MEVLCLFVDKSMCFLVVVVMQGSTAVPDVIVLTGSLNLFKSPLDATRICLGFAASLWSLSFGARWLPPRYSWIRHWKGETTGHNYYLTYHFSNKTLNYGHRFWSCGVSWTTNLNLQILAISFVYILPLMMPAPGLINWLIGFSHIEPISFLSVRTIYSYCRVRPTIVLVVCWRETRRT